MPSTTLPPAITDHITCQMKGPSQRRDEWHFNDGHFPPSTTGIKCTIKNSFLDWIIPRSVTCGTMMADLFILSSNYIPIIVHEYFHGFASLCLFNLYRYFIFVWLFLLISIKFPSSPLVETHEITLQVMCKVIGRKTTSKHNIRIQYVCVFIGI